MSSERGTVLVTPRSRPLITADLPARWPGRGEDDWKRAQMLRPEDVAEACAFLAALPAHVAIPELPILPADLQVLGKTR